jgi:hypothetical protein
MAADDGRAIGHSLHAADLAADFPTRLTSGSSNPERFAARMLRVDVARSLEVENV